MSAILNLRKYTTVSDRRLAVEKELSVDLSSTGSSTLSEDQASLKHCENMIGFTQIPLGIAGPLRLISDSLEDTVKYIPLATTEGALIASVSRGCKAITESGGATISSYRIGATRGPAYRVESVGEGKKLFEFVHSHLEEFQSVAAATSSHLRLTKATTTGVGKYRYIRFVFDTQDAMGMNMVTIASTNVSEYITEKTGIPCIAVAGNYDTDKKPSWLNSIAHRGIEAWAEITIPENVLTRVLKTTARKAYEVWLSKCMIGSALAGSMGFNAHMANILSALFIATGQDPAHVAEASGGLTTAEVVDGNGLYISIYLPDCMVGTVGGGTSLPTQREALDVLGIAGGYDGRNAIKFAEIVAGAVLAGEVSLLSSLAQGSLANAHRALGRGEGHHS